MFERIILDGAWQFAMIKNSELKITVATAKDLNSVEKIEAIVPGNFELDLFRAGKIGDPYYGTNLWDLYKYETYHLFYHRVFVAEKDVEYDLCFEGIDTYSDVYINGKKVLHTDNMLIGHSVRVDGLNAGENEILVHIYPALIEARKYEYTMRSWQNMVEGACSLYVRRPVHTYGWDILPRAVSGGIFRSCYLEKVKLAHIKDVCYFASHSSVEDKFSYLSFVYNLEILEDEIRDYTIEIKGECGDSSFYAKQEIWHTSNMVFEVPVKNCKFWYPRNYGKPNLYAVEVLLKKNGELLDTYTFNLGVRTVEIIRTSIMDGKDETEGEFKIKINDKDIFVLGTNWTPLDIYHSKDKDRLPKMLEALNDLGCNAVRCWGGNLYESDEFFDFCDKNGILVWQDFALACGLYPNDDDFCKRMEEEAIYIVKKYRNHASLCIWAGDNECDTFSKWAISKPDNCRITREVFKKVIDNYDYMTPYLPSSPYIDSVAYETQKPTSETHTWGARPWFKSELYKDMKSCFESEIGYQASPSPESLKRCFDEEFIFPWKDEELTKKYGKPIGNKQQCAHTPMSEQAPTAATKSVEFILPVTDEHILKLFGREPKNIDEYARMSQISQAEAFKYFIERMRVKKPAKMGIIWWNLFDGYPVHSNAVVDYYDLKKLAYYYIKRSQKPVAMFIDEPIDGTVKLYAVNDLQDKKIIKYTITDLSNNALVTSGQYTVNDNSSEVVVALPVPKEKNFWLIEYEIDGVKHKNHYMHGMPCVSYEKYLDALKKARLDEFEGF